MKEIEDNGIVNIVSEAFSNDSILRAWLESKDPLAVVGVAGDYSECPIARFLKSITYPHIRYSVDVESTMIDYISSYRHVRNPRWVGEFINIVDQLGEDHDVTADKALIVLDCIPSS